jgi:hypothetical protein
MTKELNEDVFESVIQRLTKLRSLHIVGCPQIDHTSVLRLTQHLQALESLSLNTTVGRQAIKHDTATKTDYI